MVITKDSPLILGSASPRRRMILAELEIPIAVRAADVAEQPERGEPAGAYIERVVADKLGAVVAQLSPEERERAPGILVADTIVLVDAEILGKPATADEAVELLGRLVGRTHLVHTRYALTRAPALDVVACARTVESRVTMRAASAAELRAYARTGEGLDKAGAYAAQGIGAFLIERIDGSYTNVVGLPACEVVLDLTRVGLLEHSL